MEVSHHEDNVKWLGTVCSIVLVQESGNEHAVFLNLLASYTFSKQD